MPPLVKRRQLFPLLGLWIKCFHFVVCLLVRIAFAAYNEYFVIENNGSVAGAEGRKVVGSIQRGPFAGFKIINIYFLDNGVQNLVDTRVDRRPPAT